MCPHKQVCSGSLTISDRCIDGETRRLEFDSSKMPKHVKLVVHLDLWLQNSGGTDVTISSL